MTQQDIDRYWNKVNIADKDSCWEWNAGRFVTGYGAFGFHGKPNYAHRISMVLSGRPIPDGMHVLHKCDNRGCVNPDHLFLGSLRDNMADMYHKRRHARGDTSGRRKLCSTEVTEIRELYKTGRYSFQDIATQYGITRSLVGFIKDRKIWKEAA